MTSPSRRRGHRPKTISGQGLEGQRGINFIENVVLGMNSRWTPSGANEVGIDGYIELFDPSSHEALGVTVAVQSKVVNAIAVEHPTFDYRCEQKDLEYWLSANIPVILVVSSPSSHEGYWIWVQGHFKDGSPDGSTRITFDKLRHRFSSDSWRQLAEIAAPPQGPPSRPKKSFQAIYPSSVVVLPFLSLKRDEKDEALSDGITETLITSLVQIPSLRVIASMSSFSLRHTKKDIRDIAATLRVRTVLEGSVQCQNDRIRIIARLVDAETRVPLLSRQYDEPLSDIFKIQDDLARAITAALQGSDMSKTSGGFKPQLGAYEAYMIGRHNMLKHTPEALERGERFLEDAANLDRRYAEPRVALGRIYLMRAIEGISPPADMLPLVAQQAQEALQIDESDPRAHTLLGISAIALNFDWHLAASHFTQAFQTAPVAPETRQSFSVYLAAEGKYDLAAQMLEKALKDDLLNVFWRGRLANHLNLAENFDRALAEAAKALTIDEHYWLPHYVIAENHVLRERFADALSPAEAAYGLAKRNPRVAGLFAGVLAKRGFKERADALVRELSGSSVGLLFFYLVVGEREGAMDALLQSIEERQLFAVLYVSSPFTRVLRLSEKWSKVVEVMKLQDLAKARVHFAEDEST
jgi:TolB-like protein/Flp pilus assembly protein TadD